MAKKTAVNPKREENYPLWYQEVIKVADLAETSEVRGCMVIKPWGYSLWENIQRNLDDMFKETGHKNAYFPLFIPKSFFEKEAEHVEGFAKECAVVTHSKLIPDGKGGLRPAGELAEPLIVRPTSETIIGASFSKWVNSYRDLPLLINQWANVVRWEMRTRLFLRTTEFLWQEGHTVHADYDDAMRETLQMLDVYSEFAETYLALPVIKGEKTAGERFPGAINTYCIEALMQDKKALQAGTSHFLGQNFAKASDIKYTNKEGEIVHAWTTSWGVSTRLIGALIMAHGDDNGMVMPPRVAPSHIALIPFFRDEEVREKVMVYIDALYEKLRGKKYHDRKLIVELDDREMNGSEKSWDWIKKGIPIRLEIGPKDIDANSVFMGRRDKEPREKVSISVDEFVENVCNILDDIQKSLYDKALQFRTDNTVKLDDKDEFVSFYTPKSRKKPEIHGGFSLSHWCGETDCEDQINTDLKVTIRCIPNESPEEDGSCIYCGKPSKRRVLFAKCY